MGTLKTPADLWIESAQHTDDMEVIRLLQSKIKHYRTIKGRWPPPDLLPWAGTVGISEAQLLTLLVHLSAEHAWAWDALMLDFCVLRWQRKPIPADLAEWIFDNVERTPYGVNPGGIFRYLNERVSKLVTLARLNVKNDADASTDPRAAEADALVSELDAEYRPEYEGELLRIARTPWTMLDAPGPLPRPTGRTAGDEPTPRDFWIWLAYEYLCSRGRVHKQAIGIIYEWEVTGLSERRIGDVIQRWERERPDRVLAEILVKNSRAS